jgi:cyclohexa-1,5-dienecarbonyl-CoA hydratase
MSEPTLETITADLLEDGTVLRLLLSQPKANVLTRAMMEELSAALDEHRDRQALRLVILSGQGPHFSFGASVPEHRRDVAPKMLETFHGLVRNLASYPVPVAALVRGQCLGGAFELVLCCHFVFATPSARFACPEIKLGVFPPVLAALGGQRLGGARVEPLLLTGDALDAATAHGIGFVTRVLEDDEDGEEAVLEWYRGALRPLSAFSLRQGTGAVRNASGLLQDLEEALAAAERQYVDELVASHDGNEGIEAFLAKRQPVWKDA